MKASRAAFRADASTEIGGGHVTRCLALADVLTAAGWSCAFACRAATLGALPELGKSGHALLVLDDDGTDEVTAMATEWLDGVDWLIVDHYGRNAAFERACRGWTKRIMVIDDLADRAHDCDLLLDQTLGRTEADYAELVPRSCTQLLGPCYALLRPQFACQRANALDRRKAGGSLCRVLVTFGASDPDNVTGVVLSGLAQARLEVEVDVVLGEAAPHLAAVRAQARRLPMPVTVGRGVGNMARRMAAADLAIGAAGTTSWERCCLGLPTLLVMLAENQERNTADLVDAGAALSLGRAADLTGEKVTAALKRIADGEFSLGEMATAAAKICDGLGAGRISAVLQGPGLYAHN